MKKIILIILALNLAYWVNAQDCDWANINEANLNYSEGNFDEALNLAKNCLDSQSDINKKIEALRLISKTYLALDKDSAAVAAAMEIIELKPKFEPSYLTDPPQFIEIIDNLKKLTQQFVVVSISKKEENINKAPATAIVLNSSDIKNRGYLDFEAVLHDLPGFDISRSNGNLYTHAYQRGYRSINTNRTLFLIDGVEDNDLWSSNVYLSRQFVMSNVKSVEVVYGPASTMYGSNAFLGVINIISKEPSDVIGTNKLFGMDVRAGYGSYNTKFIDGTIAMQTKDHHIGFMISGRTFFSDEQDLSSYSDHDYEPSELTDELASQYRSALNITDTALVSAFLAQHPSSSNLYSLDANNNIVLTDLGVQTALNYDNQSLNGISFSDGTESYAINAKLKIYDFTLGWYYWQKAEGPGSQYNDLAYLGYNQGQSWAPIHHFLYLKYEKEISDKLTFTNFLRFKTHYVSKNNRIVTFDDNYLAGGYDLYNLINGDIPGYDSLYLFYKSNQLRNETKISYQPTGEISILGGLEVRFSSNQGDYFLSLENDAQQDGFTSTTIPGGNQFFSRDIGAYLQGTYNVTPNLDITLGGRYDYNKVRTTEGYGSVFNERAAIVYSLKSIIFKGIFATAFKDATNREKYSTAPGKRELPNPLLEPEKVKNFEFSIAKQFNQSSVVNISFYHSFYSNIIQEVRVLQQDGTYTNQNQAIGQAQIYGVNAYGQYKFKDLCFYANYTYTQPYTINPINADGTPQTDSEGNVIEKLRISDIANNRANFGLNYLYKNSLNLNLRFNYVGKRITGENTTVPTNTSVFDPYFLVNSTISYDIRNTGLSIQLTANNILNTEYFEPDLDAANGSLASMLVQNKRNIFLSIYYNF